MLDPFCGCATTCIAAEKLGRRWIGIDVSSKAHSLVKERIEKEVKGRKERRSKDKNYKDLSPETYTERHLFKEHIRIPDIAVVPPKRTDKDYEEREKKFVYIVSHKHYKGRYKVGIAKNAKTRLNYYQTADPDRAYKLEYTKLTHKYRETEKHIHAHFDAPFEWVTADLQSIRKEIEAYESRAI